jgi:hypothetical protein
MYTSLHVKYPLFLSGFNKTWFSRQVFEQASNIKFHENRLSESWVVPRGRTDMRMLIVAFRDVSNAPKRSRNSSWSTCFQGLWEWKHKEHEMLLLTTTRFFIECHNVEMVNIWTPFVSVTMNTSLASIPGFAYNFINPSYKVYNDPEIISLYVRVSNEF